jgi:hypothetical protein
MKECAIQRKIDLVADSPYEQLNAIPKFSAWHDHPLGRPVHGTKEGFDRINRDDVLGFFDSHYTPDSMIVSASFVRTLCVRCWELPDQSKPRHASNAESST